MLDVRQEHAIGKLSYGAPDVLLTHVVNDEEEEYVEVPTSTGGTSCVRSTTTTTNIESSGVTADATHVFHNMPRV